MQANSGFHLGVFKWPVSWNRMRATVYGWRHLVKATEVTAGLAESNDSLPLGGWLKVTWGWLPVHGDQLRDIDDPDIKISTNSRLGDRAFTATGPRLWYSPACLNVWQCLPETKRRIGPRLFYSSRHQRLVTLFLGAVFISTTLKMSIDLSAVRFLLT